ncbi:MAG: sulfurtransferase-like selenium metabolism protein YedF [Deltaproteobacteria bacterium]|nr:sulfurtransferase-like selenium metabolism protein YedF [Deltaproteobacteria bacterium]MBW2015252.1 sulfurtransferase-like selenium metabolism protein YedF [Deltaproteobacteria bacterium]MBW2129955.1 sulfurtransferase-like selenium metabolism protein YedF [Deltaproteobacteria bacterium]MBW2302347.1 sulfurtransferase-like selenium metabolism protein YedF [Deltaproteobacteria bacterium]
MKKEIDCRGLACPAPVLETKKAIEEDKPSLIRVTVDNEAARQNVTRFLETQKYQVSVEKDDAGFHVTGIKEEKASTEEATSADRLEAAGKKILIMVATDRMGHGDDGLGKKLLINFLTTLEEMGKDLWRLVFVNNGVKLTIDGSEALPVLKRLEENGITILVCGTCLDHFDLLDRKKVGETTNMLDIVTAMQLADKVINI